MEKLVIKGGNKLSGEVTVSGSKNAALPIFISTILAPGCHTISNVPFLRDINTTIKVLEKLGAKVDGRGNVVKIDTTDLNSFEATYDLVRTMRAAARPFRPGPRLPSRRLRHRRPPDQPAPEGARRSRRRDHP